MSVSKPAFRVYDHIENHFREKFVALVLQSAPEGEIWYATEKIHGSNFSWILSPSSRSNNCEIRRARRGNFLKEAEEFYGSLALLQRYNDQLTQFYELCQTFSGKKNIIVQVVGEIYGGAYEGCKGKTKAKAVQKEIKYCPDVDVRAFDVMIDGEYQNYLEMIKLFEQCPGLPYVPILHKGTLEEMLKLDPVFATTIPALSGLPALPMNDAEGYVLKPVIPRFITFSEDSVERVIFKLKNPKFSEKNEMNADHAKVVAVVEGIPENINETVANYVNQNRMDNVKSKLTEAEQKNKGKVIQGLIRDVLDELIRDLSDQNNYNDSIKPTLKNLVSKEVAKFVMTKI